MTVLPRSRRLAWRLTLLFVLAAMLPLLLGGLLASNSSFSIGRRDANVRQQLAASLGQHLIANYLDDILSELRVAAVLSGQTPLQPALPLRTLCQDRQGRYFDLVVTDEQGQERAHLVECQPVAAEQLGQRASDEPFFRAKRGETFIGTVSFAVNGEPLVRVSERVETATGPHIIIAQVNLADLWQLLSDLDIGEGGYIYIVDRRGTLIGYKDLALVRQNRTLTTLPTVAALLNQQQGVAAELYVGLLGEEVMGTSAFVPGPQWGIVVEQPAALLFAAQNRLIFNLALLIAAVGIGGVAVALWTSRPIVMSIRALVEGADAIAQGDFSRTLPVKSRDEIGTVSEAFNLMTARLRELISSLEQRVAELARAEAALRRQLQELSVLHAIAVAGAEATDEAALVRRAVEIIGGGLYEGNFGVLLLDEAAGVLRLQDSRLPPVHSHLIPLGEGLTGQVALTGQPLRIDDVSQESAYLKLNSTTRSELCVPLKVGERILGVLNAESPRLAAFSAADERLLVTFAGQLATAIDRLRADAAQRRRMRQLTTIYDVGRRVTSILTLEKLLPEVAHLIAEAMQLYNVEIALVEQDRLVFRAGCGGYMAETGFQSGPSQRLGEGITGRVASTGEPLQVTDVSACADYVPVAALPDVRSEAAVPLRISGQVIGVLDIKSDRVAGISADDIATLEIMADQVAVAVQTAQLFEELQRQTRELAALYNAAIATSNVLETDLLLQRLYDQVQQLFKPDAFFVSLYEAETATVTLALAAEAGKLRSDGVNVHQPLAESGLMGWLIRNRRPLLVGDLAAEPVPAEPLALQSQARSCLGVPLIVRGRLVGAVAMYAAQPHAFNDMHSRFLESLASQVAIALENARLFQSTVEAAQRQAILHWASQEIASAGLDLQRIYVAIYQSTVQLMPSEAFVLSILDERRGDVAVVYHVDRSGVVPARHIPLEGTMSGYVITHGQSFMSGNEAQEPTVPGIHFGSSEHVVSVLAVPLRMRDRTFGMLSAQSYQPNAYTTDDLHLLELLAAYAAAALENARLFEALRRQLQELSVLHAVAQAGAEATDEDALIERATQLIGETLYPDNFGVILLDETAHQLKMHPSYRGLEAFGPRLVLAVGQGVSGKVVESGRPRRLADVTQEAAYIAMDHSMRSELCVPLRAGEQIIGVVNAESAQLDAYSEADERLLATFAGQLGTAIARVRLFAEIAEALGREQRLNEVARIISSALDLPVLLSNVVRLATELVRADLSGLALVTPDQPELHYVSVWNLPEAVARSSLLPGQGLVWRVFNTGQSIFRCDYDERSARMLHKELGASSCLIVPVLAGEERIGALALGSRSPGHRFTERDLALAESVGRQAGVAIQNARLFAEAQQRTAELTTALEKLQELDRLKSEFIQNVSHELRTPLAIIRGYAELLEADELGELKPEQREPVTIIVRRVQMLTKMVGDLTAILEAETQRMHYEVLDMVDLVRALAEDFRVNAEKVGLQLVTEMAADLPPIWGDPAHLRRVVDNLVGNALKFTPAGGTVTLRLSQVGANLVLEVADTGIGIPQDKLERVFERFYQVDGSMSRRYGGTGLGLALVKEIVQAHHGTVAVRSVLGRGTTFSVTLPIMTGSNAPA